MSQIVKLRRSSVSGQKPTNSNLQLGELALNTTDGKVYMSKSGSLGPTVEELISTNTVNTGSVNISGSLNLIGNETITGSLYIVSSSLPEVRLSNVDYNQNYHITVGNAGYLNIHDGLGNYVALFGTSSASLIGDLYVSHSVTASHFTGSFVGDGSGLYNIPLSGVTNLVTISGSFNDRINQITGSVDSLNTFTSSVVLTSQTSSMNVLSASYAVTAAFALNAGGSGGGATLGTYSSLVITNAASTWSFQHDTGQQYPIFQVFDENGYVVIPSQIQTIDDNNANIIFPSPQTGRVIASLGGGNGTTKQFTNSNLWVVDHNLGTDYPDVTVWDSNRNIIFPNRIESVNTNQIKIYFSAAITGHVSVSRGGHILSGSAATISGLISGSSQITNLGFATTGSNTFVGSQTINGCLTLNNAKICSTAVTISSNTEIFNLSSFDGAFFDYVVKNGSNMRAGSIMSAWDGTDATFNETTTMDLGTTNAIGFNVSGTGRLNATISSGTWLVEVLYRALGNGLPPSTPTPTSTPAPTPTRTPTPTPSSTPGPTPTATAVVPTATPTATPGGTVYTFSYDGMVGTSDFNVACAAYPMAYGSNCYSYNPTIEVGTTLYSTNTNGILSNPFVNTDGNIKVVVANGTTVYAIKTTNGTITELQQCTTPTYSLGQTALGGKIGYILQSGDTGYNPTVQHGLVVYPFGGEGATWGCHGTVITGADGTALGTGYQNTVDIVNGCATAGTAAKLCSDLVFGGYSDWYLPSKDELNLLYVNQNLIGGFDTSKNYWTSTESSSDTAWAQYFLNGFQGSGQKNDNLIYYRPVRSF